MDTCGFHQPSLKKMTKKLMTLGLGLIVLLISLNGCEPTGIKDPLAEELSANLFQILDCSYSNVKVVEISPTINNEIREILSYNSNSPCINSEEFKKLGLIKEDKICLSFEINSTISNFVKNKDGTTPFKQKTCRYNLFEGLKVSSVEYKGVKINLD